MNINSILNEIVMKGIVTMQGKCLKATMFCLVLAVTSTTANAALIRYDFMEEIHPAFPAGELFSGYYIFDSDIPNTSATAVSGEFINPVVEIGINFNGQNEVFNNCLNASCSTISTVASAEEHYYVSADLYDVTGTRSISLSLRSGDMFLSGFNRNQYDFLELLTNQTYSSSPTTASYLSFEFQNNNGIIYSDNSSTYSITRVGEVPVPAAVWLFGSGLIGLIGFARRKKA